MLQGEVYINTVMTAIESSCRMIDTAEAYGNEAAVGEAIQQSSVDRRELFLVTEANFKSYENAEQAVTQSLNRLQTDYIDLLLLRWPFANYYAAWRILEKLYAAGRSRAIGVSNFEPNRLLDLLPTTRWSRRSARLRQIFTASAARSGAGWQKAGGPHGLRAPGAGLPERNVSGARRAGPSEKIRQDPGPGHAPLPDPERRRRHSQKHPAGAYPREF